MTLYIVKILPQIYDAYVWFILRKEIFIYITVGSSVCDAFINKMGEDILESSKFTKASRSADVRKTTPIPVAFILVA